MWTEHDSDALSVEQPGYLQQRVSLFGLVWTLVSLFGLLVRASTILLLGNVRELQEAGMWLQVLSALTSLPMWLLCRRGERPTWLVQALETSGLLATSVVIATMARVLGSEVLTEAAQQRWDVPSALFQSHVSFIQQYFSLVVSFLATGMLTLRSALVPSSPRRTLFLSAVCGVAVVAVLTLDNPVLQDAAGLGAMALAVVTTAYWLFAVMICMALSLVIHGLRREVRAAQRLGQYTLEEKLGEGGMGIVYRASHAMLRRATAVKLLPPERVGMQALARFEREVQLTAQLTHPNTITVFDYGHTPDGVFYYAMELLAGATLEQVVEVSGAQPPERVVHILMMVAGALSEAHQRGLIHRDIKPANIILSERGGELDVAKVLDFGLVKEIDAGVDASVSREGIVTGTPMYMPPEALKSPDAMDGRADLYALGAVGYFLLTGRPVFDGKSVVEVCGHHLHTVPEPPSRRLGAALPEALEALVLQCLRKEPSERPDSAQALGRALRRLDLDPWTQADARRWWDEHGAAIKALRSRSIEPADGTTVDVLVTRRG